MAVRRATPQLLTEREWRWWFGVDAAEARRLVHVQRALVAAGCDPSPDTTLGMSRTVLAGGSAAERLRALADLWERVGAMPAAGPAGWQIADGSSTASPLRCRRC